MSNLAQTKAVHPLTDNLSAHLTIVHDGGVAVETDISFSGAFTISSSQQEEFLTKLSNLISDHLL